MSVLKMKGFQATSSVPPAAARVPVVGEPVKVPAATSDVVPTGVQALLVACGTHTAFGAGIARQCRRMGRCYEEDE